MYIDWNSSPRTRFLFRLWFLNGMCVAHKPRKKIMSVLCVWGSCTWFILNAFIQWQFLHMFSRVCFVYRWEGKRFFFGSSKNWIVSAISNFGLFFCVQFTLFSHNFSIHTHTNVRWTCFQPHKSLGAGHFYHKVIVERMQACRWWCAWWTSIATNLIYMVCVDVLVLLCWWFRFDSNLSNLVQNCCQ